MKLFLALVLVGFFCLTISQKPNDSTTEPYKLPATLVERIKDLSSQQQPTLFTMPTTCNHRGNTYQESEEWTSGHLRYSCGKYGVYEILGCVTDKGRNLVIGETYVSDNLAHQCFKRDFMVFYRQSICGLYGQPDCDKITEEMPNIQTFIGPTSHVTTSVEANGLPAVAGLPEGWSVVDANNNPIQIKKYQVVVNVIPIENTSTPLSVVSSASQTNVNSHRSLVKRQKESASFTEVPINIEQETKQRHQQHILTVKARSEVKQPNQERIVGVGTGSTSLDARSHTNDATENLLPGTVGGQRSDVKWSGKTATINGKTIAVGPGTFMFGTSPTGTFVKKIGSNIS